MKRQLLLLALASMTIGQLLADEGKQTSAEKDSAAKVSAADNLKANPNDIGAFNAFMSESVRAIVAAQADPDDAEKKLAAMKAVLADVKPDSPQAKTLMTRANATVRALTDMIELARVSVEELAAKVDENPQDAAALSKYLSKAVREIASKARTEPDNAATLLDAVKARLEKASTDDADESVKKQAAAYTRTLTSLERTIEAGKKLVALIGQDAAPLEVEAWVNGTSLTDADLKGKVVLLDFWAVWCGPCIATFPHLKEWHEKYSDKGLVIIGLTNYYNYSWNEDAGRAQRSQDPVSPEAEQEMLQHFAEHHGLHHRFAVQPKGSKLSDYYGVTGIPQAVVIDQTGKVRMIRVGSGDSNAHDIDELLEKLLAGAPAS